MTEHAVPTLDRGILSENNQGKREELIEMLKKAYWMEIETVMSYITNSINPDGLRAQEVIEALSADIQEELGHAQEFANRIKELWGVVPGSLEFRSRSHRHDPAGRPRAIPVRALSDWNHACNRSRALALRR
jgi:bacterioferritin